MQTALTNNYLRKTSGNVVNADISASAAIAYTKLNLGTSIVNADIAAAAAIVGTKIATGTITSTNILDGTILNADINAAAGIVPSKVTVSPYCLAYRSFASGAQSFAAASGTMIFSAAFDTTFGSMWAGGAPSKIVVPAGYGGWYKAVVCGAVSATGATTDHWELKKNGATILSSNVSALPGPLYNGETGVFQLIAADFVELVWTRVAATGVVTAPPYDFGANGLAISPASEARHYGALLMQFLGA